MPRSLTLKSSLLIIMFCLAAWVRTQTSHAQPRAINLDFTMRPGETRLEGTIRKIDRARQQFTLEVDILVAGDNTAGDILGPGPHTISVDDATSFGNRKTGNLDLGLDNLVPGSEAIIIGHALSPAGLIKARLVAVSANKASPLLPQPGSLLNPGRLAQPALPPKAAPPIQPAPTRQAPPAPAAVPPPPKPTQPEARPLRPAQATLAVQNSTENPAQRAAPGVVAAPPHSAVRVQLKPSTPQPLPRLGQGVATYTPDASAPPPAPVRSASVPATGSVAPSPNVATRIAALPAISTRVWPTPTPVPTLMPTPIFTAPAPVALPTQGGLSAAQNPSSAPALTMSLPATAPTATTNSNQGNARATNPLDAITSSNANLTALTEAARQRFQARQIAQNEIYYNYFSGGTPQEKLVALTFDDGPNPAGTPAVLDILQREGVPATFFLIGRNAEKHPELVLRELAEGHDIGNHTYHHHQRTNLSLQEWRDEISQTNAVIVNIIGAPTRWFRAPGCHYTAATLQAIQELGMVRVDTTNNSSDWDKRSAEVISQSVLERLAPGNVLLFHDPMPETARALPHLIHEIRNRGYRFVLLGELALRAQATPGFEPAFRPLGQGIVISK